MREWFDVWTGPYLADGSDGQHLCFHAEWNDGVITVGGIRSWIVGELAHSLFQHDFGDTVMEWDFARYHSFSRRPGWLRAGTIWHFRAIAMWFMGNSLVEYGYEP